MSPARNQPGTHPWALRWLTASPAQPTPQGRDPWAWASLVLLLALLALVVATFRHYGITFDEQDHDDYGWLILELYRSGLKNWTVLNYKDHVYFGGLYDTLSVIFARLWPGDYWAGRHLFNALVGWLGLLGLWKLVHRLAGSRAAFLAVLLLALTPTYYGHMFNNPKDVPFAVGYVWSLYYLACLPQRLPRPPARLLVRLGLAVGCAMGVRIGGLLLWFYLGLILLAHAAATARAQDLPAAARELAGLALRVALPVAALSYALMVAFWPAMMRDPLGHPFRAMDALKTIPAQMGAGHQPWYTIPYYFAVQLPEIYFPALALALLWGLGWLRRGAEPWDHQAQARVLAALALFFPLLWLMATGVSSYDNNRHFTFLLPPMAAVAALGLEGLAYRLRKRPAWLAAACALGLAFALQQAWAMVSLHPYQYVFYNHLVGGLPGAVRRGLKTDYWVHTYKEAVSRLERFLEKEQGPAWRRHRWRVLPLGAAPPASHYFPPNFVLARDPRRADFIITHTIAGRHRHYGGRVVDVIRRQGVGLCYIKDLRRKPAGGPPGHPARESRP